MKKKNSESTALKLIISSLLLIAPAFSQDVDFERTVRIVNLIVLNETRILFSHASELISEGGGKDEVEYFSAATIDNSFFLQGDNLYINGRMVMGFKAGGEYTFRSGVLYSKDKKALLTSPQFLDSELGRISTIRDDKRKITIRGIGIGGGITDRYADGYMIWASSYVCTRIWDGNFYLWGIDYGHVDSDVEVNLKDQTVTIDKGKPVKILIK